MRDENVTEAEFAEHVDDSLHGRVISDGDGGEVENASELNGRRAVRAARVGRKARIKHNQRIVVNVILLAPGVSFFFNYAKI